MKRQATRDKRHEKGQGQGAGDGGRGKEQARAPRPAPRAPGFTLVELIAVVVILGILMVTGTVSYTGMVARSRWRAAQDLLLAIYYGEQAYQSINRTFYPVGGTLDASSSAAEWRTIYMENPNLGSIPITFTVAGAAATFTATATSSAGQSMTVNESRVWCGSSTDPRTCPTWPMP